MKIITLNVWQGRLSRNFAPFFEKNRADIVCLQELNRSPVNIPLWDVFRIYDNIKKSCALNEEYFSATNKYKVMDVDVEFGNGVFTDYKITNKKTVFINGQLNTFKKPEDYRPNTRNAQIVELETPNGKLTIVNHHGYWESNRLGSQVSVQKLQVLAENLSNIRGPLIVVGDFNLASDSEAIQAFKKQTKLIDLTSENKVKTTLSPEVTPYVVDCDHIFVSQDIKVQCFKFFDELLSDHKALLLEFDII